MAVRLLALVLLLLVLLLYVVIVVVVGLRTVAVLSVIVMPFVTVATFCGQPYCVKATVRFDRSYRCIVSPRIFPDHWYFFLTQRHHLYVQKRHVAARYGSPLAYNNVQPSTSNFGIPWLTADLKIRHFGITSSYWPKPMFAIAIWFGLY